MKKTKTKIFQPNLIYVFSYKKLKKECKKACKKYGIPTGWAKEINGRVITQNVNPCRPGTILGTGYSINIKWCKCIGRKLENEKRNCTSHNRTKTSRTKFPVCG